MDRFRAIKVFMAVARAGSLSAAARDLGEPLTTVSRHLAALESHVGTVLLARTTRRMSLTEAGHNYLETCRRVIEELDGVESQIAGGGKSLSGEIAIAAPVVFGRLHVLPIVAEFLAQHPRIGARMQLLDRVVDLLDEDIDVAVRIGQLPNSSLLATRVGKVGFVTCASPAYLAAHGKPKLPADLAGHPCVIFGGPPGGARWSFKGIGSGRVTVRPRVRLAVNSAEAAIDAASAGVGITRVLSYQAQQALSDGRLKPLLQSFDEDDRPIHLVTRGSGQVNLRVRSFLSLATKRLRAKFQ